MAENQEQTNKGKVVSDQQRIKKKQRIILESREKCLPGGSVQCRERRIVVRVSAYGKML